MITISLRSNLIFSSHLHLGLSYIYNLFVHRLHGSYEALEDGHLADALVDFTGGVSETIDLKANDYNEQDDKRTQLFEKLVEEVRDHSVMCSVISVSYTSMSYLLKILKLSSSQ